MNKHPLKLNLGSGPVYVPGYICIDKSPTLLLSKIFWGKRIGQFLGIYSQYLWDKRVKYKDVRRLSYKANSVDAIYSSHLLEHLYYSDALKILNDCFRLLRPGGIIRLALPDYNESIRQFLEGSSKNKVQSYMQFEEDLLSWPLYRSSFFNQLKQKMFGDIHMHKWHPIEEVLVFILEENGFINIKNLAYGESENFDLSQLEIFHAKSFYLEAQKPEKQITTGTSSV